jgi:hypothetical protein
MIYNKCRYWGEKKLLNDCAVTKTEELKTKAKPKSSSRKSENE